MKLLITLEVDVKPNNIGSHELPKEIKNNTAELKEYFSDNDEHDINGLRWNGIKVLSISQLL